MPEVGSALVTDNFYPGHAMGEVFLPPDRFPRHAIGEAWPTCPRIELGLGCKKFRSAANALINTWGLAVPIFSGERTLRGRALADLVLLGGEFLLEFGSCGEGGIICGHGVDRCRGNSLGQPQRV